MEIRVKKIEGVEIPEVLKEKIEKAKYYSAGYLYELKKPMSDILKKYNLNISDDLNENQIKNSFLNISKKESGELVNCYLWEELKL